MPKKNKDSKFKKNLFSRAKEASTVRKIVLIIIFALLLIFVIGAISGYMYIKSSLKPVDPDNNKKIEVDIPMGASTSEIATILDENDIINNALIFRFYIKFKNESDFQAGDYTFTKSMTSNEIIQSLQSGKIIKEPVYTVTIPEGKTIQEIAEIYADKMPIKKETFLDKVNDADYIESLMEDYPDVLTEDILDDDIRTPLEGYLFAATYDFYYDDPNVEEIVGKMLEKTNNVVVQYLDDMTDLDLTVHEALTFASLVEKEASDEDQRKKIAGLFYNRLDENIKLQTDPTVLYALGEHKTKIKEKDLKVDSPYNTYQIDTLPIGPISNFSESSLEATIHPEESDYLYFLHDDKGDIHFSETYDEHIEKKKKYIDD
ncbi:MAG TPA: endolytic transglycosylase MltG [Virgibacillus sp.]|nr:endolytic transglycosylase MltG [Virgibacillus sp.]